MNQKILMVEMACLAMLFIGAQFALAQETEINPDENVNLGWEKFKLFFTFNQEKKAEKEMQLADAMLAKAQKMAEKGNLQAMESAQKEYEKLTIRAQERIQKLEGKNSESSVKTTARIENQIELHNMRLAQLKESLIATNLTDEERVRVENAIERISNRSEKLEETVKRVNEKQRTRAMATDGITETQADKKISEIRNKAMNLTEFKKEVAENRINQTEKAIVKAEDWLNKKEQNCNANSNAASCNQNFTNLKETLAEAKVALQKAKELYALADYAGAIEVLKPVSNLGRILSGSMSVAKAIDALKEMKQNTNASENRIRDLQNQQKLKGANK